MWLQALGEQAQGVRGRRALRAARWAADTELLRRETPPLRLSWRVEELACAEEPARVWRTSSARSCASRAPATSRAHPRSTASPSGPRPRRFSRIAARLADLDRPVASRRASSSTACSIDGSGPLYDRERVDELPACLDTAIEALEPR